MISIEHLFAKTAEANALADMINGIGNQASQAGQGANQNVLNQVVNPNDLRAGGADPLTVVLNQVFYVMLVVAVALSLAMVIRGAVQYMTTDGGDAKGSAKKRIQAALGGLVLAFSSILLLNTINGDLTTLDLKLRPLNIRIDQQSVITSTSTRPGTVGTTTPYTGPVRTADGQLVAQINNINNPNANRASVNGAIVLNGNTYSFISGGGGDGYLPPGTYTISDGRLRSDNSSMMVDGYGYSFNLTDAYDPRIGRVRDELRIHPDGGSPGTIGCIGIQGNRATQEQFYRDMQATLNANNGRYTITVGQ